MKKKVIVVLGMHRSGTSMVAGCLALCGIPFGQRLLPPASDNVKGFWEQKDIVAVHDLLLKNFGSQWSSLYPLPLGWAESLSAFTAENEILKIIEEEFSTFPIWGLKDPRICLLLPLWLRIFHKLAVDPYFIHVVRNPEECAGSLAARNGLTENLSTGLWIRYNIEAIRNLPATHTFSLSYDEFLANPSALCREILTRSDLNLLADAIPTGEIESFCEKTLKHHDHTGSEQTHNSSTLFESFLNRKSSLDWLSNIHYPPRELDIHYIYKTTYSLYYKKEAQTLSDVPYFKWGRPLELPSEYLDLNIAINSPLSEVWIQVQSSEISFDARKSINTHLVHRQANLLVVVTASEHSQIALRIRNHDVKTSPTISLKFCPGHGLIANSYSLLFLSEKRQAQRRSALTRKIIQKSKLKFSQVAEQLREKDATVTKVESLRQQQRIIILNTEEQLQIKSDTIDQITSINSNLSQRLGILEQKYSQAKIQIDGLSAELERNKEENLQLKADLEKPPESLTRRIINLITLTKGRPLKKNSNNKIR